MAELGQYALLSALVLSVFALIAALIAGFDARDRPRSRGKGSSVGIAVLAGAVVAAIPGLTEFDWTGRAAFACLGLVLCGMVWTRLAPWRGDPRLLAVAERASHGVFAALSLAIAGLAWAFYSNDFSLEYVAHHSSSAQPRLYAVTAVWGGMAGSLLLWSWILAAYASIILLRNRSKNRDLMPWATATFAFVNLFFLGVITYLSNPFDAFAPSAVPFDGMGLNPLLQNPGMVIHPPLLYIGFVGTTVPMAFAVGALATGRLDERWIRISRRWTLTTWAFLGAGILLGAWWAYEELGWGGYWAWDPVENASLMPWLTGTAYLHSVMIQEKRGMLKIWNMILVFLTFWLSVFGTFLTRSGFVQSVHTFAQSPIGWWFLGFLILCLILFVWIMIRRAPMLGSVNRLESVLSKEASFVFNNWLFVAACFVVFLGTVGEPISRAFTGVSTTFRAPYYNELEIPIFLMVLALAGIAPLISWRRASAANLRRSFTVPAVVGVGGMVLFVAWGIGGGWVDASEKPHIYAMLTLGAGAFVLATVVQEFVRGARTRKRAHGETIGRAFVSLVARNRRRYGGYVVHVGVTAMFAGIAGSAFDEEAEALLKSGESLAAGGYEIRFVSNHAVDRPDYSARRVEAELYKDGEGLAVMMPERRFYERQNQPTTEVSIHSRLFEDVYLIPGGFTDNSDEAILKVHINPLVGWVWAGGLIMLIGSAVSLWPERGRRGEPHAAVAKSEGLVHAG
ncbi:MAG: cytochrome C biogenesis protein [Gemmatimonadetes bacterium]|nr:cytochrome C biogenesis protein [Gemmatimonadota bacterium]